MACLKAFSSLLGLAVCLPAADLSLLNLAMPDARVAGGINVEQARATRLGQRIIAKMQNEDQDFQKFVAMTGFDPRRDVREILIVSPAGKSDRKLVIARGVFNRGKLEAAAGAHGATSTPYNGFNLWTDPKNTSEDAFAILDDTLAIAGDTESLRHAIDRRGAGRTAVDPAMLGEISKVSGLYDAWFVSLVPVAEFAGRVPDQRMNGALKGDAFKGVRQASGGVSLRQDAVQFSAELVSATSEDANSLAGALQFLGGLLRMGQQQEPSGALSSMTNTLSVVTKGNVVNVSFAVPEQVLDSAPTRRHRRVAPAVQARPIE